MVSFEDVKNNPDVRAYISKADESLIAMGYTEHSFAHVTKVATTAAEILKTLGHSEHEIELVKIAGFLHDIGNIVNRIDHAQSGAVMAFRLLDRMNMPPEDIATVVTAIGNHDESTAFPVNSVAAALMIADKTDVRRSRVRNRSVAQFDIHDRVNYSVTASDVKITQESILLELTIEQEYCTVLEYFEIFMTRMLLFRIASEALGVEFRLYINGQRMM